MALNIAVVGATGLVGRACIACLQDKHDLYIDAVASDASSGQKVVVGARSYQVSGISAYDFKSTDVVFLCVRAAVAKVLYARLERDDLLVIDNSSAFRGLAAVPLVIPEITPVEQYASCSLISSPNCVAIPLAMLLQAFGSVDDVVVTTFQSLSGAGQAALDQRGQYDNQITPYIGEIDASGQCVEEQKIAAEVKRLVGHRVTVLCTRVPVDFIHQMHVSFRPSVRLTVRDVLEVLQQCPYIEYGSKAVLGSMKVHVHRVFEEDGRISLWVLADNLHRGAAGNMVGILEGVLKRLECDHDR